MAYSDGTFTSVKQSGPTRLSYPFLNNPTKDSTTKMYETDYAVLPGSWTPATALMTYPGDGTFAADANAYLVEETPPQDAGGYYKLTRRWAKVPGNQVTPGSRLFMRPPLHDIFSGSAYAVSFDNAATSHVFSSRISVSTVGAITAPTRTRTGTITRQAQAITQLTLGSYNIDFKTGTLTSSFNANAPASTIKSTIEGGGSGCTVQINSTNYEVVITVLTGTMAYISTTDTNLEIEGSGTTFTIKRRQNTSAYNETQDTPADTITLNVPTATRIITTGSSHSGAAGGWMAAWNGDKLVGIIKPTAASGTSVTIPANDSPWNVGGLAITHLAFATQAVIRVVNGYRECSMRTTQKFYLPTVTTGITAAADIPGTAIYADAVAWLGRLIATTLTSATATAATDQITKTGHGIAQGETFFLSAIGSGAAGLAVSTQYWAIYVDANNIKAATSQENALAGTAIDITSDGTGLTLIVPDPWPEIALADLKQWNGPILTKSIDEVQMADALESRPAAA